MQHNGLSRRSFAHAIAAGAAFAALPKLAFAQQKPQRSALVRLSANENPYGPSASAMRAMTDALHDAPRYPDELSEALCADVATFHKLTCDEVLLGDGSSDILRVVASAYGGPGKKVVIADPTFEAIAHYAQHDGTEVVKVPLDASYAHDLDKMKSGDIVYICNPNNPTATITPKAKIREFLAAVPQSTIVLVDEAYHHYTNSADYESVIPLVATTPNLIVARTFSKIYAMAGVRAGYAVAKKSVINKLSAAQQWDAMNVVALAGARASLADSEHVITGRRHNDTTKQWLRAQVKSLGYEMLPSEANFVMIDVRRDVKPLISGMREHGVHVGRLFPAMPHHLRVTIGRPEEMEAFVGAFKVVMA